jgi:hypothetical protein
MSPDTARIVRQDGRPACPRPVRSRPAIEEEAFLEILAAAIVAAYASHDADPEGGGRARLCAASQEARWTTGKRRTDEQTPRSRRVLEVR